MKRITILIMLLIMLSVAAPVYATSVSIEIIDLGSVKLTQDKRVASVTYDISNYNIAGKIKLIVSGIAVNERYPRYLIITDKPVSGSWWNDAAIKSDAIYFATVATAFTIPIDRTDYFTKNRQGTLYIGISVSGSSYWTVTLKLRLVVASGYLYVEQTNVTKDQAILLGLGALAAVAVASAVLMRMRR